MHRTLYSSLLLSFLGAIVVTGVVAAAAGAYLIGDGITTQAQDKARLDLNSARLVYSTEVAGIRDRLHLTTLDRTLREALLAGEAALVQAWLTEARIKDELDYLDLVDLEGHVRFRTQNPPRAGDALSASRAAKSVLAGLPIAAANVVLSPEELALESPELASRVSPASSTRASGLVIEAAAAVSDSGGRRLGVLVGGVLLNRTARIVERIRRTIYASGSSTPLGHSSIFLGDVRIATTLTDSAGESAVGTIVDPEVSDRVLGRGESRVERAHVLGEWWFTAYDPLRDVAGRPVGMLALGIAESNFSGARQRALLVFVGITIAGILLTFFISRQVARRLSRPLAQIASTAEALSRGKLDSRLTTTHGIHELDVVASGFNAMAESLREREAQLKYRTQEQLGKAERLAMIGRLAAGVAHEINNPLGGITLFANLLLRKAPPEGTERANLERICHEAKRCQRIVQGLLDFARPREPKLELLHLHEVVDKTLQLVVGQPLFQNIEVEREYDPSSPRVRADPAQMEQVVLNLVVNAAEAMSGKGKLTVTTRATQDSVQLSVADTGCGIPSEQIDRLFEPFFTTKAGTGTGLGLSISRGIVENHGGSIWVASTVGQCTRFTMSLPVATEARQSA